MRPNTTAGTQPPAPIFPKSTKKLKLLDIDPLELARQLTLMEAQMYKKIRPIECLQRSREQKAKNTDNIAMIIQLSNRVSGIRVTMNDSHHSSDCQLGGRVGS